VALPLLLLAFVSLTTPLIPRAGGWDTDGRIYGAMLQAFRTDRPLADIPIPVIDTPAGRSQSPWTRRVLTPWLASLLPFEPMTSFRILGFASNWASLVLVYAIARGAGLAARSAELAQLFYAGVFWTLKFSWYSPGYIDFQTQLFLLASLAMIGAGRWLWLGPVLALGVLQKESALAMVVVAVFEFVRRGRPKSLAAATPLFLIVGFPLAAVLVLRAMVPGPEFGPIDALLTHLHTMASPARWPAFAAALFSGLGILPVVILHAPGASWRSLRARPHWLVWLVLAGGMLFGGSDKSRLFLYALPVCAWLGALAMRPEGPDGASGSTASPVWESSRWWIWVGVSLALHFELGHHWARLTSFDAYLTRMVPMHAPEAPIPLLIRSGVACAVWLGVTWILRPARGNRTTGQPGDGMTG
jgi:hypothetical protein